jgi:hypothetical protein
MIEVRGPVGGTAAPTTPALPPLHNALLATLTGIQNPRSEARSTCADCTMCGGVERSGSQIAFSPKSKCCTYIPHLANFLVGQSLLGPGRQSIADRIGRMAGVTPLGLGLSYADIRRVVGAQAHFGQTEVVVCPHFVTETQGCAIWQTRNAVCSTWFCKHERGAVTQRFWHAVRDLLIAAEERIAARCLTRSGLAVEQVNAVLDHRAGVREIIARANSGQPLPEQALTDETPDWYERMWGEWAGREQEWFAYCGEAATALSADDLVSEMTGLDELVADVAQRWRDLGSRTRPDRLTFTPGAGSDATADVLRLVGYSPLDPLVLPVSLLDELILLDGRETAPDGGLQGGGMRGTALPDALLCLLQDFGVAVAPG